MAPKTDENVDVEDTPEPEPQPQAADLDEYFEGKQASMADPKVEEEVFFESGEKEKVTTKVVEIPTETEAETAPSSTSSAPSGLTVGIAFISLVVVCMLAVVVILQLEDDNDSSAAIIAAYMRSRSSVSLTINNDGQETVSTASGVASAGAEMMAEEQAMVFSNVPDNNFFETTTFFSLGENVCEGQDPKLANVDCIHVTGPQAGGNVTEGFSGTFEVDHQPLTTPYWQNGMCPINVHWHLGTEHYSVGQYDEEGDGPNGGDFGPDATSEEVGGGEQPGYRCRHYDENEIKFTRPYEWKHCVNMEVGETYEVHWPHSAAGACGTINQYQTPFADGVFCRDGVLTDVPAQVGVQAQVYTVVNDEAFFYPDLIRGWIIDGNYGQDIHYYTGSTTGSKRNNEICSAYTPITWQVDRKCHLISASSFDKLCYDMKLQRDDMSSDLYPHGSRPLVATNLVANNGQRRRRRRRNRRLGHSLDLEE